MTRKTRAVNPDGTPTMARDERGILLDLSGRDVEMMAQREPGSAKAYLEQRQQQLVEQEERERAERDKEDFVERFMEAGGTSRTAAEEAYRQHKNETAAGAARAADAEAAAFTRAQIRSRL